MGQPTALAKSTVFFCWLGHKRTPIYTGVRCMGFPTNWTTPHSPLAKSCYSMNVDCMQAGSFPSWFRRLVWDGQLVLVCFFCILSSSVWAFLNRITLKKKFTLDCTIQTTCQWDHSLNHPRLKLDQSFHHILIPMSKLQTCDGNYPPEVPYSRRKVGKSQKELQWRS